MKAKNKQTVPVTTRALVQRINRVLSRDGEQLKITRGPEDGRARQELGDYYVIDLSKNAVTLKDVNLEVMARKLGVLKAYESVSGEL